MGIVTTEGLIVKKATSNVSSEVHVIKSTESALAIELTGTGAISATVNVYGGIYNTASGTWTIRVLDDVIALSGTTNVSLRKNTYTASKEIQIEVVDMLGTNATISVGLINAS